MSNQPTYISNLLPRLRQFSKSLNQKELFVDKPWVMQDDLGNRIMYIFYRDSKLKIIYPDGSTGEGTWSYNIHVNRLFINNGLTEIALKQDFVENGLMILKVDDATSSPWIVVNEKIVPDLNIKRYLISLMIQQMNLSEHSKVNGQTIYSGFYGSETLYYDNELNPLNIPITYSNGKTVIYKNGRVYSFYTDKKFSTDKGPITIRFKQDYFSVGSHVFMDEVSAPDGIYKVNNSEQITVQNGVITKTQNSDVSGKSVLIGIISLVVLTVIIIAFNKLHLNNTDAKSKSKISSVHSSTDEKGSTSLAAKRNSTDLSVAGSQNSHSAANTLDTLLGNTKPTTSAFPEIQNSSKLLVPFNTVDNTDELYVDDLNYTPQNVVAFFLGDLSDGNCNRAWNYTFSNYWEKQGKDWFCTSDLFGGMTNIKIAVSELEHITSSVAQVYIEYSDYEVKNGTSCFKQNFFLRMFLVNNQKRWMIVRLTNEVPPSHCN